MMKAAVRWLAFSLALALCVTAGMPAASAADGKTAAEPVGQLKILARYNDSMQFYDGHVYLLFTSYRDGVTITVDDLYAGYEINEKYYADIKKDISFGSNHNKQTTAADYFRENREMKSVTLNRGELVTIGMYRAFDLSIIDAALGTIQNSTVMKYGGAARDAAKTAVMENLFSYLKYGTATPENAFARLIQQIIKNGIDPGLFLDGTVPGGLCFNRELYNQKLEWDQYENASFALDIDQDQLNRMVSALQGNLNKFSILKNSCATVALRAWNAAVGTDGQGHKTAYYLESSGKGIFSYIDAPKTVKAEIMTKLPGYWLNSSAGVAEPNAGYVDETGWVYVSAPKKLDQDAEGNRLLTANSMRMNAQKLQTGKPAGRLTIAARHFLQAQIIAHSVIVFTPYQTMDLDISWYDYYQPTDAYIALMEAYADHPENFASDPALYSDQLPLGDRAGYFDLLHDHSHSAPKKTHLKAGESVTISSYPHDETYLRTAINTLANGKTAAYEDVMTLVTQMRLYDEGKQIDGPAAFDAMVSTVKYIFRVTKETGRNPADGETEGGIDINREAYNQFVHDDNQFVYIYYTVELTAQELENLKAYLADGNKNSYALFTNNCSTSVVDLWNTTLQDRPELALYANLTNFLDEPESLCIALNNLRQKTGKEFTGAGEGGGTDYTLHIAPAFSRAPVVNTLPGAPQIAFSNLEEVAEAIAEDQNARIKAEMWVNVSPLNSGDLSQADLTAAQKFVEEEGLQIGTAFDISLFSKVDNGDAVQIHETQPAVRFAVTVPESMRKADRVFYLIRLHDGLASAIAVTGGDALAAESDLFSPYLIAYRDPTFNPAGFDDVAVPSGTFHFTKKWEGSSEPSIDFTLYKQGGEVYRHGFDKHAVSGMEWRYSATFSSPAACYVIEEPMEGYITRYENVGVYAQVTDRCCDGGTIVNKRIPRTGDSGSVILWAGMALAGIAGIAVTVIAGKHRKKSGKAI